MSILSLCMWTYEDGSLKKVLYSLLWFYFNPQKTIKLEQISMKS